VVLKRLRQARVFVLSRVVEWFVDQHPDVQALIVGGGDAASAMMRIREQQAAEGETVEALLEKAKTSISVAQRALKGQRTEKRKG